MDVDERMRVVLDDVREQTITRIASISARINGVPQRHSLTSHLDDLTARRDEGNSHVDTPL